MGQVQVNHGLAVQAQAKLVDHLVNGAGSHIARNEVAVLGIPLLEEIKAIRVWNLLDGALVAGGPWHPDPAAFATGGL